MVNNPLVSVWMITYNHEKYISQALDGILMQKTNFNYEIVIGEDCSTDRTREICIEYQKKYPDKIKLLLNEKNIGVTPNFIQTLKACKGKYIALCEGDDYWTDSYKLQKQVDFLEANPEYSVVYTDCSLINSLGDKLPDTDYLIKQRKRYRSGDVFFNLLRENFINTLTVCLRAECIISDKSILDKWYIYDYYLWLQLAKKGKVQYIADITACYRIHATGLCQNDEFFRQRHHLILRDALKLIRYKELKLISNDDYIYILKLHKYLILNNRFSLMDRMDLGVSFLKMTFWYFCLYKSLKEIN